MAQVKRFTLPDALAAGTDVFVPGAGLFLHGVLDVAVADSTTLAAVRTKVPQAVETGPLDSSVTRPPVPFGDPYPEYLKYTELIDSVSGGTDAIALALKAAFVPSAAQTTGLLVAAKRPAPMTPVAAKAPALAAQAGHIWTSGGSDDTTVKLIGELSRKITTGGAGSPAAFDNAGFGSAQDWSKYALRLRGLRVDDVSKLAQVVVYVQSAGATLACSVPTDLMTSGDWHTITLSRSMFSTNAGTPNWAAVTKVYATVADKGAGAVTMNFHGIDLVPDYASVAPNGIFILECDDGYASQKSLVLPLAESLGIPITWPLIAERVTNGLAGITTADMKAMQRNGHAFTGHAFTGAFHGAGGDAAAWLADFTAQQQWYDSIGLPWAGTHYSMCAGTGNFIGDGVQMDALRTRFRSVRMNTGYYQAIVPGDPHRLPSRLYGGDSLANLQTLVNNCSAAAASATGGAVLTFAMHESIAGSTNGTGPASGIPAIAINNLKTLLQYAQSKGMTFMTRPDYLDLIGL